MGHQRAFECQCEDGRCGRKFTAVQVEVPSDPRCPDCGQTAKVLVTREAKCADLIESDKESLLKGLRRLIQKAEVSDDRECEKCGCYPSIDDDPQNLPDREVLKPGETCGCDCHTLYKELMQHEADRGEPWTAEDDDEYRDPLSLEVKRSVRILLSTGGPGDWIDVDVDEQGSILGGSYHNQDWFDHAEVELDDEELRLVETIYGGLVESACECG